MAEIQGDSLRALIRLIPPARALKEDLERSIHLELYAGTGDLAVRSFGGLQASVAQITGDPYVAALALNVVPTATDKEKVSLALLAAGQLTAFLEGQTGLVGLGGGGGGNPINVMRAPTINIANVSGLSSAGADKVVEMAAKAVDQHEREQQAEAATAEGH